MAVPASRSGHCPHGQRDDHLLAPQPRCSLFEQRSVTAGGYPAIDGLGRQRVVIKADGQATGHPLQSVKGPALACRPCQHAGPSGDPAGPSASSPRAKPEPPTLTAAVQVPATLSTTTPIRLPATPIGISSSSSVESPRRPRRGTPACRARCDATTGAHCSALLPASGQVAKATEIATKVKANSAAGGASDRAAAARQRRARSRQPPVGRPSTRRQTSTARGPSWYRALSSGTGLVSL